MLDKGLGLWYYNNVRRGKTKHEKKYRKFLKKVLTTPSKSAIIRV